jgi:hypothetical protein
MTRPRLQLHLSTLLIVTLLAAGLVWLNVQEREVPHKWVLLFRPEGSQDIIGVMYRHDMAPHGRGWPSAFEISYDDAMNHRYEWVWHAFWLDALLSVQVLALAGVGIEQLTRRMKRKRDATEDEAPPKRRFWYIHLSTAVVVMLIAGGLLYLNLAPAENSSDHEFFVSSSWVYGWPWTYREIYAEGVTSYVRKFWFFDKMLANVVLNVSILLSVSATFECLIRRRSRP